jgi:uncharacterized protein (UPF0335 family)
MLDQDKTPEGLDEWIASGAKGASAKSIAAHLAGHDTQNGDYPHDGGDFGRCEALLDAVPSLRLIFPQMVDVNAYWAALVPRWAEIAALGNEEQTKLIKNVVMPIEELDPSHHRISAIAAVRSGPITFKGKVETTGRTNQQPADQAVQQFKTACELVFREQKCSTSYIQRKLSIGYNKAARLVELMQSIGLVSRVNPEGGRDVVTIEVFAETLKIPPDMIAAAGDDLMAAVLQGVALAYQDALGDRPDPFEAGATQSRSKMEATARKGRAPMKDDPEFSAANDATYRVTADELRQFVERYERLEVEKKDIADQQKEVMAEAKGRGYDTKVLRKVIALRKKSTDEIAEEEAVLEMYKEALGMA